MSAQPEEFTSTDLRSLRTELLSAGLDSWQAAELIGAFLAQRGYGVSNDTARHAVPGRSNASPAAIASLHSSNRRRCSAVGSAPTTSVFVKSLR